MHHAKAPQRLGCGPNRGHGLLAGRGDEAVEQPRPDIDGNGQRWQARDSRPPYLGCVN